MAKQAEAERERRAKVINAEGEFQAAARLAEAAEIIGHHPEALQLRYLQTMTGAPSRRDLLATLDSARGRPVLVLGDVMLDHYLLGEVGRISPEAPVPVVRVRSERHTAGGAGNVARNLASLGARPFLLAAVGDDDAGRMLAALLEAGGVEAVLARETGRPTTIKTRIIAQNQQVARVDRESEAGLSEGGRALLVEALRRVVPQMAAVVVSDYAKGVIGAEVMVWFGWCLLVWRARAWPVASASRRRCRAICACAWIIRPARVRTRDSAPPWGSSRSRRWRISTTPPC